MAREFVSKKDRIEEIKEIENEIRPPEIDVSEITQKAREHTGGSISTALAHTGGKNQWLTSIQKKNPFIGKGYIVRASEYETDDKVVKPGELKDIDEKLANHIDAGTEAYDPNSDYGSENVIERKEKRNSGDVERKLIDHCIAVNIATKLIGCETIDVEKTVEDEIKKYHEDPDYVSPIDIAKSIEYAKTTLLLAKQSVEKITNQNT